MHRYTDRLGGLLKAVAQGEQLGFAERRSEAR